MKLIFPCEVECGCYRLCQKRVNIFLSFSEIFAGIAGIFIGPVRASSRLCPVLLSAGDMPAATVAGRCIYPHETVTIPLLIRAAVMEIFGLPAHPSFIRQLAFSPFHANSERREVEHVVLNALAKSPQLCRLIPAPSAIHLP